MLPSRVMDIMIITYHYPPELYGAAARSALLEKGMVDKGCSVRMVIPQESETSVKGARVISVLPWFRKSKLMEATAEASTIASGGSRSTMKRMIVKAGNILCVPDILRTWARQVVKALESEIIERKPDLLITISSPESTHLAGLRLSRKYNIPWLADIRDGWLFEPHRAEAAWPVRVYFEERLERMVMKNADYVGFSSRSIMEDSARRYSRYAGKFFFYPSGIDRFYEKEDETKKENFTILYAGRFGYSRPTRKPWAFFEALERTIKVRPEIAKKIKVELYGEYSQDEMILAEALEKAGVVRFQNPVHPERLKRLVAQASVLLLITSPGFKSIVTRKIFDYMSARRPILALAEGNEAARIIKETDSGLCAPPNDPEKVMAAIVSLYESWEADELETRFPYTGAERYLLSNVLDDLFSRINLAKLGSQFAR